MGRRAYMTQMALGRSAFQSLPEDPPKEGAVIQNDAGLSRIREGSQKDVRAPAAQTTTSRETTVYQQQYDSRGYPINPVSREQTRQSRRAMNDALATVGVCVRIDTDIRAALDDARKNPELDQAKIDYVAAENSFGNILFYVDCSLDFLVFTLVAGLRTRLQTFRSYSNVPITQIMKAERNHFGIIEPFLLGLPASLMNVAITMAVREDRIKWLVAQIALRLTKHTECSQGRDNLDSILKVSVVLLRILAYSILAPLEIFATLQRLGLLPSWPWFPHPRDFIPFTSSSPLQLPTFPRPLTINSSIECLFLALGSPVSLICILSTIQPIVFNKLRVYARVVMPRPTTPDRYSLKAAEETGLGNDSIPGLEDTPDSDPACWESTSLLEELAWDLQSIGRNYQIFHDYLISFLPIESDSASDGSRESQPTPSTGVPITNPDEETQVSDNSSAASSRDETSIYKSEIAKKHKLSLHRLTTLTTYAADNLASRLSLHLVDVLFLPLGSLYLRKVALGFLSSPRADPAAQAAAARWKSEVFPVHGWCGMGLRGGWGGVADYAGKMALVFGMEMGVSFTIWQIGTGVAWVVGRKLFGWEWL